VTAKKRLPVHIPGRSERYFGADLGAWVKKQRLAKQNDVLEPERIAALEAVPGWTWGC
jgi:hypothetical protein